MGANLISVVRRNGTYYERIEDTVSLGNGTWRDTGIVKLHFYILVQTAEYLFFC